MNQPVFTHNGFPKVGIRPIIDGRRRGIRESLEDQTMAMAKAAAKLIRAVAIAAEKMWLVNAYGALDAADISLDE